MYPYACCCMKKLQFSLLLFIWARLFNCLLRKLSSGKQWKVKQTRFKAKVIAKLIHFDWSGKLSTRFRLEYWVRSDCLFEWSDRNFHGRIGIMEVCIAKGVKYKNINKIMNIIMELGPATSQFHRGTDLKKTIRERIFVRNYVYCL